MKKFYLIAAVSLLIGAGSCTKTEQKTEQESTEAVEFYAAQPTDSGVYSATYYSIVEKGDTVKKGKFDGRVIVALDPDRSGLYVFENGNRTKIDYRLVLKGSFEETEEDVYKAETQDGKQLTWTENGAEYHLSIETPEKTVTIKINRNPIAMTTAADAWERISRQLNKK